MVASKDKVIGDSPPLLLPKSSTLSSFIWIIRGKETTAPALSPLPAPSPCSLARTPTKELLPQHPWSRDCLLPPTRLPAWLFPVSPHLVAPSSPSLEVLPLQSQNVNESTWNRRGSAVRSRPPAVVRLGPGGGGSARGGQSHGGVFRSSAGREQNICPLRSRVIPCSFLLLLFQNVQGPTCLPTPLIRKPLSFPMATPSTPSPPVCSRRILSTEQRGGRCEGAGRGTAASTDAGRKGAFLSLLGYGRDPGWGVVG